METVAVFGGSFSPVHKGHMEVARAAVEKGLADRVLLMPCRRNPLKDGSTLMDDESRLEELSKAADYYNEMIGERRIEVDGMELTMPAPSYTCDTLKALRRKNPGVSYRLLTGADSYLNFGEWKNHEWIERNFNPVVYPRPGYDTSHVRPEWTLLEGVVLTDISSTSLRRLLANGESVDEWMPWKNIRKH